MSAESSEKYSEADDNLNFENEYNNTIPDPMVVKLEPDIEELPLPESENQNAFQIQNHFQIVSVQSLHPLQQFSEINENKIDKCILEENTNSHSTIKEMLNSSSEAHKSSFGIAQNRIDKSNYNDDYDDNNSLLVETKNEKRGRRRTIIKNKKSKLDIFRKQLGSGLHKTHLSSNEYSKDNDCIDQISDESVNEPILLSSEDQQQASGSSSFSGRSTRRKSVHKPYDIAIEIVDDAAVKKDRLNQVRSIKNPHVDYIKKVAFLRVCVNYILKELGHPQFNFNRSLSLKYMKSSYINCSK